MKRKCAVCKCTAVRITPAGKGWCGGVECGTALAGMLLARKREADAAVDRKQTRLRKQSVKPRRKLLAEAQAAFNWFIRERDWHLPCVSCGRPNDGQHQRHASHYKPTGSNPAIRFDEANCHAGCSVCNNYLSGNLIPYRVELIRRLGQKEVDRLEGPHEPARHTVEELEAIKTKYNAAARSLRREREQRGMVGCD